jgi:hypothetical protein
MKVLMKNVAVASMWDWKSYLIMKYVTETIQSVYLWLECKFQHSILLYSTPQYSVEVDGNNVAAACWATENSHILNVEMQEDYEVCKAKMLTLKCYSVNTKIPTYE